jgi:hypothetical protein
MKASDGRLYDWMIIVAMGILVIAIFSGFVFSNRMLFGTDMVPMGFMMRKAVADHWRQTGSMPMWDPYILCGLPVVDAMHGDLFYPVSLFYLVMSLEKALGYKILLHVWLAGVLMYFLLRTLHLKRRSSLVGGLGYMTAPYFLSLIYAGHDGKMFVTALFPLCVMLLERLLREPKLLLSALFGGSIGLLLLTSHPQMAYFASWGLGIYFIFRIPGLLKKRILVRAVLLLVLALAIGAGIGCVQFLPTYHYTTNFSPRTGGVSYEFASSWSLHPEEIVSLLYPSFVGYLDSYWGRNPFKLNAESPGPLILLLALGGFLLMLRRRDMLPWLFLFIFCPIYALGAHTPVFKMIFYGMPGAKFLRAPSIIMFMFSCSASVLAAFLVDSMLAAKPDPKRSKVLSGLLLFMVVVTILVTVGRGLLFDLWGNLYPGLGAKKGILESAKSGLVADAVLLLVFAALIAVVARTTYGRRWKGALWLGIVVVGLLVTSLMHSHRFIDYIGVGDFQRTDPLIEHVTRDKGTFRTLPITSSAFYNRNYLPIFGIETANGFYDNRIRYYDTMAGENFENLLHPTFMRIANIKYVLTTQRIDHPLLTVDRDLGSAFVYRNTGFLPRAFLVHRAVVVGSDSAALELIKQPSFDAASMIVLHEGEPLMGDSACVGEEVRIRKVDPGRVIVEASVNEPAYLFYSGNYLPSWRARVDGEEVPVLRCDVAMRAVFLDPGEHMVEMIYVSKWFRAGAYICLTSCVLTGLIIYFSVWGRKKRSKRA